MPTILALSSTVAVGHVGLAAITPAASLAGGTVWGLPTITLSNHPGFPVFAGARTDPDDLRRMIDAIAEGGWLGKATALLTGYLPSADHVAVAAELVERMRKVSPATEIICDPILGDDPKGIYIDPAAADAIRDRLVPLADCILPNRFELEWLSGISVRDPQTAAEAAKKLARPQVIAKSIPDGPDHLANVEVVSDRARYTRHRRLANVPNGTGDVFSALIASGWDLPHTAAALDRLADLSTGLDHLRIVEAADQWRSAPPLRSEPVA
jgi:pyridoxine kinase